MYVFMQMGGSGGDGHFVAALDGHEKGLVVEGVIDGVRSEVVRCGEVW